MEFKMRDRRNFCNKTNERNPKIRLQRNLWQELDLQQQISILRAAETAESFFCRRQPSWLWWRQTRVTQFQSNIFSWIQKSDSLFFGFVFFVFKSPELVFFFGKYVQIYYSNPKLIVKKTLIQRDKQFQENYDFCANYCQEDPKVSKLSRSFFSLVPMVLFYRFYLSTQLTLPSKSLTLSSKSTIETVEKGVKYVQSLQ